MDVDVYRLFETLAPKVPLLTDVKPNGNTQITEFEAAGGTLGLLRQLAPLLDLSARTVAGGTLGDALDGAPFGRGRPSDGRGSAKTGRPAETGRLASAGVVVDENVIRPLDKPYASQPAIVCPVAAFTLAMESSMIARSCASSMP